VFSYPLYAQLIFLNGCILSKVAVADMRENGVNPLLKLTVSLFHSNILHPMGLKGITGMGATSCPVAELTISVFVQWEEFAL